MVNCCVPGCTNYSAKSTNISYHKIPKDPQLRKAWISRLRRENLPPLKNCYVCSEHFDNECFESDFMEQLIGEKKRKRLKVDAIPSIFTFTSPTAVSSKRRATTENRIERKRQKETLENILAPSSSGSFADATHEESDMEISEDEVVPSDTRDIGIQCCLENRFMVTTTISTQTNKADIYANTADACIQVDENSTLEKLNILHDHTYATSPVSPVVSPQKSLKGISPQKSCGSYPWSDDEEATCNGDVKLLREKWVSVLHHVRNKHSWNDAELYRKCAHPCLTRREVKRKCWLKPGTPAYVALEEVVLQPKLLKDLANLTDFCHTGGLEVYHSMIVKYCPKREHFSYKGMVARTQLAAIDNNHNTGRKQAVIQRGERVGEARYRPCFPKMHRRWVVKPVLEKKSYAFLPELQKKVLGMCNGTEDPLEPTAVYLPPNIASEPAPGKQDLIKKHRSRFSR
ncbi:THAP domain-containing protein 2 [Acropora cervicornis]|uniref:THAP domain-containing protein 2 n=1 Tax=Acropora cervicornis TaxID=6130 RepID=A0AAD9QCX7_ACRCE|nr:THAP domain-containing protein 2 [Acropora cervicornis]